MNDPMSPDEIKELTVYQCATIADCLSPDSLDSPGAGFLSGVRDEVLNRWDSGVDRKLVNDVAHEIADDSPDTYTHSRWEEFVDLGAYREESPDGEWPDDLTQAAAVALYQIAERLAIALLTSLCEWQEEQEEQEDAEEEASSEDE